MAKSWEGKGPPGIFCGTPCGFWENSLRPRHVMPKGLCCTPTKPRTRCFSTSPYTLRLTSATLGHPSSSIEVAPSLGKGSLGGNPFARAGVELSRHHKITLSNHFLSCSNIASEIGHFSVLSLKISLTRCLYAHMMLLHSQKPQPLYSVK